MNKTEPSIPAKYICDSFKLGFKWILCHEYYAGSHRTIQYALTKCVRNWNRIIGSLFWRTNLGDENGPGRLLKPFTVNEMLHRISFTKTIGLYSIVIVVLAKMVHCMINTNQISNWILFADFNFSHSTCGNMANDSKMVATQIQHHHFSHI